MATTLSSVYLDPQARICVKPTETNGETYLINIDNGVLHLFLDREQLEELRQQIDLALDGEGNNPPTGTDIRISQYPVTRP